MEIIDRASELEIADRELRIAVARQKATVIPDLGCHDCSQLTHEQAKATCRDFKSCLADWQKIERMKQITGDK